MYSGIVYPGVQGLTLPQLEQFVNRVHVSKR